MDHETYLAHIVEQAEGLKAAAIEAGPSAPVPTCPEWTVRDLVEHIAQVHNMVTEGLKLSPGDQRPPRADLPADWDSLLAWWDAKRIEMVAGLGADDPAKQAWSFVPHMGTLAWWARRQAHETAIHRLDAEHAKSEKVPTLLFNSELAADGIDEALATMSVYRARAKRPEVTVAGTLLVHAADAGRTWLLRAYDGVVEVGPVEDAATDADATLAGTADAVYRAVWKRPSHAIFNGRSDMMQAVNGG
ncbi:maleylpyruvate isomerase family mycothiol-dependent enzyme [Kibdelosporangium philippinense]|uniref:Maleylpyruvate isomerase family mycothiol-dependent enzyme n=1 Tax=Kibdelosporangium philippinense TaxID=211113 RepID=A0ABS8ZE75_9PSEU|nr:maleylpyruvate isomerase family mycothiol-dependent enzyme [Kibdelosporangium philippinense]MCE7005559.1 maleylpyruvate isomerase family mycothiol-dependent enzyme [Kibdelosporangium philippinense]